MRQLIGVIVNALREAGVFACRGGKGCRMEPPDGAVTAVMLKSAECEGVPRFDYLGTREQEDGSLLPVYGARVKTVIALQVIAPATAGDAAVMEQADALTVLLAQGIPGVRSTGFRLGEYRFDPESDTVSRTLELSVSAYVYAAANADETEFTDFILKGELQ